VSLIPDASTYGLYFRARWEIVFYKRRPLPRRNGRLPAAVARRQIDRPPPKPRLEVPFAFRIYVSGNGYDFSRRSFHHRLHAASGNDDLYFLGKK